MMFQCDSMSYQVSEFFEKFQHRFPTVAMLQPEVHEEIETDIFSGQQVIRIHASSSQCRVVAVTAEKNGRKCDNYSLPLDMPLKFCIKKGFRWKENKEFSLSEIIEKNKLPIEVRFAKDETITVGSVSLSTSIFPALKLTHTIEEISMLVNFITDDGIDLRSVRIPLYLKDLRLCLITGIKGKTAVYWKFFQDELTAKLSINLDMKDEHKDVNDYPVTISNESVYEELEPSLTSVQYERIQSFSFYKPRKKPLPVAEKSDSYANSSVYKNIPPELPPRNSESKKKSIVQDESADELFCSTRTTEITGMTSDKELPAKIEQYKIKDVSEALRFLKLDKYIQRFEDEMVDGRMLRSIDGNFLRDEFKFTRVEALRLMNYVKDGHIPA
ncbi:hypothetical protein ACJMK2_003742 [Sinanodonta woodiana]|uniref:SAM domain-containing protein n=1 Tax=Sinanodonta woodiana TaxID=1069815 RepID=A0ABD3Y124_SINWO